MNAFKPKTEPADALEQPQADEATLDQVIKALQASPICCRCGSQLQGVPPHQPVQCPKCKNHMRHVGGMFLEYVSPLDLSLAAPPMKPRFRMPK